MHHMHIFSVFGALSVVVAIFTAWTALDLLNQVKERHGSARLPWLLTASAAMGGGIWAIPSCPWAWPSPAPPWPSSLPASATTAC